MAVILRWVWLEPRQTWRTWAAAGSFLLLSIGLARAAVLYPLYRRYGMSFQDARDRFADLRSPAFPARQFVISVSLWTLVDHYKNMNMHQFNSEIDLTPEQWRNAVLLRQQNYDGIPLEPPASTMTAHGNFVLSRSYFVEGIPRIGGIKIASSMPGYAFAVYVPEGSPTPRRSVRGLRP
jgi:hypothetical protein